MEEGHLLLTELWFHAYNNAKPVTREHCRNSWWKSREIRAAPWCDLLRQLDAIFRTNIFHECV